MALESKVGHEVRVKIGTTPATIVGLGSWSITGGSYAELDDTDFDDDDTTMLRGVRTGGTVTFSGNYKVDDTTGQNIVRDAYYLKSDLTALFFYVDDTSYYAPNSTTAAGGGLPANSKISHIKIMSEPNISVDKGGLMTIDFEGKIEGMMRLI